MKSITSCALTTGKSLDFSKITSASVIGFLLCIERRGISILGTETKPVKICGHPRSNRAIAHCQASRLYRAWRVSKTGSNVLAGKVWVISEDRILGLSLTQQTQDQFDENTHPSNDRLTAENFRIHGDAS